jgi:SAM-dependent methyltransferase
MKGYDLNSYGDAASEIYDELMGEAEPACADLLARCANGGMALELGIGTGRAAIPLLERGVAVDGIESSPLMVHKLVAKDRASGIRIVGNDMREFAFPCQYDLVFVLLHTLYMAPSLKEQLDVLRSVATSLKPGGRFVFEGIVPQPSRFTDGQCVRTSWVTARAVSLEASMYNSEDQTISGMRILMADGKITQVPIHARYIWPAELDLMANSVGLTLEARFSDWNGAPFGESSNNNISIYIKR